MITYWDIESDSKTKLTYHYSLQSDSAGMCHTYTYRQCLILAKIDTNY